MSCGVLCQGVQTVWMKYFNIRAVAKEFEHKKLVKISKKLDISSANFFYKNDTLEKVSKNIKILKEKYIEDFINILKCYFLLDNAQLIFLNYLKEFRNMPVQEIETKIGEQIKFNILQLYYTGKISCKKSEHVFLV